VNTKLPAESSLGAWSTGQAAKARAHEKRSRRTYNKFHCVTAIPCDTDATTKAPLKG